MKRYLSFILVIFLSVIGLVSIIYWQLTVPLLLENDTSYQVKAGDSLQHVVNDLSSMGILQYPKSLILYARLGGKADKIKAGEYQLSPSIHAKSLLEQLVAGRVKKYQVVLLEGWTINQALNSIKASPKIKSLIDPNDADYAKRYFGINNNPEGLFFPDTYQYIAGASDIDILSAAYQRMQEILQIEWSARDPDLPYRNAYEALILASIVEKETGMNAERAKIAGVFVNRLELGMRLQTDPTVIYGMGDSFDGNITRADLRRNTPYNTYRVNGLPPTPIALPGRQSIWASLHPERGDSLYFVAKGDGSHYFSSSYDEHSRAVRKYQLGTER